MHPHPCAEMHVLDGNPSQIFVKSAYKVETSDAERIGVDQVAKILPSGKATGSEQCECHRGRRQVGLGGWDYGNTRMQEDAEQIDFQAISGHLTPRT